MVAGDHVALAAAANECCSLLALYVYELSIPLALAVLSTQLVHEAGHLIFALKDDVSILSRK